MKASNYALISALYADKTRGLYSDIYFPIIKYAIVKLYVEASDNQQYSSSDAVHDKIFELFGIKIPHVVIAKTVVKLSLQKSSTFELQEYENGNVFLIKAAYFDEDEKSFQERENEFNIKLHEIEFEYQEFIEREGAADGAVRFTDFISQNTESLLGFFETETEEQVEEKYTSVVFFLDYLHKNNFTLYMVANQLFWSSVIAAFLQSSRPQVSETAKGLEAEYFLDTSIAMGLLDLSTEQNGQSARDVCDIIKNSGGRLKIHPATLEEMKTILASVAQDGAYPGTGIANACLRRNLEATEITRILLNLQKEVESLGVVVFPMAQSDMIRQIISKYKGKDVLRQLAESRKSTSESTYVSNSDQFREMHDIFMDDYIYDRQQKSGKTNCYFLTTNTDLIAFCRERHGGKGVMISTSKVILELWMHNAQPAKVSSCVLTETMARCLDMHRSKSRNKLHEVARLFNKHKADVAPEVYSEFLRLLYRRARKVVEVAEQIPEDNPKEFLAMLQNAIKQDNAYFDARNSEITKQNESLNETINVQGEKIKSLEEESNAKSKNIDQLMSANTELCATNKQLANELTETENKLNATTQDLQAEKQTSSDERSAKLYAENKNLLYEKREGLEDKLEELNKEIDPWKKKRFESFKFREVSVLMLVYSILMIPTLIGTFFYKEEMHKLHESSWFIWGIIVLALFLSMLYVFYSTDKRREKRRDKAYKRWEAKPENAEYTRIANEIKGIEDQIAEVKAQLKNSTPDK